jgi:hypothetical protein
MKVFISWSGQRSLEFAMATKQFLENTIQAVQCFLSDQDIGKGKRWNPEIAKELGETLFGVFCLTPENLESRWIHFEAGAIAKSVTNDSFVAGYLLGVTKDQVLSPLADFQLTDCENIDSLRLLQTINDALNAPDRPLRSDQLKNAFDKNWPEFQQKVAEIRSRADYDDARPPKRTSEELLLEILNTVRSIQRSHDEWSRSRAIDEVARNTILSGQELIARTLSEQDQMTRLRHQLEKMLSKPEPPQ